MNNPIEKLLTKVGPKKENKAGKQNSKTSEKNSEKYAKIRNIP